MSENWPVLTLRTAGVSLIDCDHRTPPAQTSGYPYVAIPQIKDGRIDVAEARRISPEHFKEWTRRAAPRTNDVVLSHRCNPGETAHVPEGLEFALGQNLVLLRADGAKVHPPFLRWLVTGEEWWDQISKYLNHGAVFESLKCADIPEFELSIPPKPEQERISAVLASIDDKIELNRQMNRTLEETAGALYRSWFVDFDPVVAKAAGRPPAHLSPALAALFPDSFQNSDLGPIPKGWRVGRLDEVLMLQRGFDLPAGSRTAGPYPIIAASGLNGTHHEFKVEGPGVTTGRSGVLGKVYYVEEDFWPLNTSLWIKEYLLGSPLHAYHLLQGMEIETYNAGSAVPTLNRNHVHNLPVVIPPPALVQAFEAQARPLFQMRHHNQAESQTLAALRDTLLPKLLSGEVRVKTLESSL